RRGSVHYSSLIFLCIYRIVPKIGT
ncbi:carboxy-terminal ase domain protein, partial [Chlamydia psittaci 06-1683]